MRWVDEERENRLWIFRHVAVMIKMGKMMVRKMNRGKGTFACARWP